jgi:hypothetical protein
MNVWGAPPELRWVRVGSLSIDERYQRTLLTRGSQILVKRIVAEFRWARFGALLVARGEDGLLRVVDGQHRLSAAAQLRIPEVPCLVLEGIGLAEQASAFLHANRDRVAVTGLAIFHAEVVAGDGWAMTISSLVSEAGCVVPRAPAPMNRRKPGEVYCVGALRRLVMECGLVGVRTGLQVIRAAWPAAFAHDVWMVLGLVRLLHGRPGVDVDAIVHRLAAVPHAELRRRVDARYGLTGQARWMAAREVLAAIIDGRREAVPRPTSLQGLIDGDRTGTR